MDRRDFLKGAGAAGLATLCGCRQTLTPGSPVRGRLFFTSAGKTCFIRADGSGMRPLELNAPNQVTWQPIAFFPDGRRVLFMSMEARRDGPGRPFDEFYWRTPTHIWIYDLTTGSLVETAGQDRLAAFYSPALLLGADRMLVQVLRTREGQMFNMRVDG
ncbi:MAG: twin-arginine translocation signal domain-containing protein, partial [Verrucomicrobia bacterium]|nr:twin-arginine translocation signal domain-containing protein [Verrucomicrobiota bacterium]